VVPEIRELDLNPVKVLEPGRGVIVVDGVSASPRCDVARRARRRLSRPDGL